jgi:hypothetical protein
MDTLLKSKGVLTYNPNRGKRDRDRHWRAILDCDHGLVYYYHWWVKKHLDVYAVLPSVRAHLTLVKWEPPYSTAWGYRDNEKFEFTYEPVVHQGQGFYWLNVQCSALSDVMVALGFPPKERFHLTVAKQLEIA